MRAFAFALLFSLLAVAVDAHDVIFTIEDPYNDDYGDGSIAYPVRSDLQGGDLDLRTFTAWREGDNTVFQATFSRPIQSPGYMTFDGSGTPLSYYARFGFYTFNIDVYIDTDRIPGSGLREMLPGRHALVTRDSAWEKTILLTPRPYEAKTLLERYLRDKTEASLRKANGALRDADKDAIRTKAKQEMKQHYFVATQIRVVGPSIQFYVPNSYLGGPAKNIWSYVVAVSAADIFIHTDLGALFGKGRAPVEKLMIVPVNEGRSTDSFGETRDRETLQAPLLDILTRPGERQQDILMPDNHKGEVEIPGVVPASEKQ